MSVLVAYALTTVLDVKESLGIPAGNLTKDNLIIRKINQATETIEDFCRLPYAHHFAQTTYTDEEYDGTGISELVLRMRPVTTLSAFSYRNGIQNVSSWSSFDSTNYYLDIASGVVKMLDNNPKGYNRVRVTYTAGYSTIPADLAEACVVLAGYLVDNSASGVAVKAKSEGSRSIEYFQPSQGGSLVESLGIDDTLNRYINYTVTDAR